MTPGEPHAFGHTSWRRKFGCAFRGLWQATLGTRFRVFSSWFLHGVAATAAIAVGLALSISPLEWAAIALAIGLVVTCELLNSSIEFLSRAVTRTESPEVRDALDIAAGAVLFASFTACAVGAFVFVPRLFL